MLEELSVFLNTEAGKVIIPALIGAFTAIIVIFIKDIVLHELRESKKRKNELLDRKLSQVYGPLYMIAVTGQNTITSILSDDKVFEKLISNLHLLSPNLQKLLNDYNALSSGDYRNPQFIPAKGLKAIEISKQFATQLEKEMTILRKAYD